MAAKPDTKKIVFYDTLHRQAEFKVQLAHDGIGQSEFYRAILTGYIKKDPDILAFVDKIKASKKVGKPTKKSDITKSKKLIKKGDEMINKLGLAENEVENIFDIIQKEHPEL